MFESTVNIVRKCKKRGTVVSRKHSNQKDVVRFPENEFFFQCLDFFHVTQSIRTTVIIDFPGSPGTFKAPPKSYLQIRPASDIWSGSGYYSSPPTQTSIIARLRPDANRFLWGWTPRAPPPPPSKPVQRLIETRGISGDPLPLSKIIWYRFVGVPCGEISFISINLAQKFWMTHF